MIDVPMSEHVNGWMDESMDKKQMVAWTDGQMDEDEWMAMD